MRHLFQSGFETLLESVSNLLSLFPVNLLFDLRSVDQLLEALRHFSLLPVNQQEQDLKTEVLFWTYQKPSFSLIFVWSN